jgi:L-histidine Nalpha-methyltransferase
MSSLATGRDGSVQTIARSARHQLADDLRRGLALTPPTLPPRWFYDERGSLLFDEITRLPEYYPTRRETEILTDRADAIAAVSEATALVELGSGMSTKTRLLLDALTKRGRPLLFAPVDVSSEVMLDAARAIAADYPTVAVEALVADFAEPLPPLPGRPGSRLVVFLGGTIGNFDDHQRGRFLARLRESMAAGDHFLLGADLAKDPQRILAAYDDSRGVTAAFNRNLIAVVRRELDGVGLEPAAFDHVARWNAAESRIEMWLRANRDVHAELRAIDLVWDFPKGSELLTEISVKFAPGRVRDELSQAGLREVRSWTDRAGDFALTLSRAD